MPEWQRSYVLPLGLPFVSLITSLNRFIDQAFQAYPIHSFACSDEDNSENVIIFNHLSNGIIFL